MSSGKEVELGRLVLLFPSILLIFSGLCLVKLFLRLKVEEFT